MTCDFDDKFLCGYTIDGWELGYDNKLAASIVIDGLVHTQSHAPQFDHTLGRYPGKPIRSMATSLYRNDVITLPRRRKGVLCFLSITQTCRTVRCREQKYSSIIC